MRIEKHHRLLNLAIHHQKITLQTQRCGPLKALVVVANEHPSHHQLAGGILIHDSLHIHNLRQHPAKMFTCIIQHPPHRSIRAPHHALHPIHRSQKMRAMNPHHAARANKNILAPIGHPHHLMRHHLANRQNQIVPPIPQQLIHLRRPRVVQLPLAHLAHELPRNLTQRHNVIAPVVHPKKLPRRLPKHRRNLRIGHRRMRPQRRQHIGQPLAVKLPNHLRQLTSLRVKPRKIRRNREHLLPLTQLCQGLTQPRTNLRPTHLRLRRPCRKK